MKITPSRKKCSYSTEIESAKKLHTSKFKEQQQQLQQQQKPRKEVRKAEASLTAYDLISISCCEGYSGYFVIIFITNRAEKELKLG